MDESEKSTVNPEEKTEKISIECGFPSKLVTSGTMISLTVLSVYQLTQLLGFPVSFGAWEGLETEGGIHMMPGLLNLLFDRPRQAYMCFCIRGRGGRRYQFFFIRYR